jgi:hypothetical protein
MERRGSRFILDRRITSSREKTFHGGSAPCSDGAVKGSRAIHVLQMDVGPVAKQAMDRVNLSFRIVCGAGDESVGCVMQGAASTMIVCSIRIGAGRERQSDDLNTITGCGQMQAGVSNVNPMGDAGGIQLGLPNEKGRESWIRPE